MWNKKVFLTHPSSLQVLRQVASQQSENPSRRRSPLSWCFSPPWVVPPRRASHAFPWCTSSQIPGMAKFDKLRLRTSSCAKSPGKSTQTPACMALDSCLCIGSKDVSLCPFEKNPSCQMLSQKKSGLKDQWDNDPPHFQLCGSWQDGLHSDGLTQLLQPCGVQQRCGRRQVLWKSVAHAGAFDC